MFDIVNEDVSAGEVFDDVFGADSIILVGAVFVKRFDAVCVIITFVDLDAELDIIAVSASPAIISR